MEASQFFCWTQPGGGCYAAPSFGHHAQGRLLRPKKLNLIQELGSIINARKKRSPSSLQPLMMKPIFSVACARSSVTRRVHRIAARDGCCSCPLQRSSVLVVSCLCRPQVNTFMYRLPFLDIASGIGIYCHSVYIVS